ncbi:hypothetical protein NDU88_004407 [Pleurodeles waltl]|uniref:Uncharacterized protein n=1 Tax=Pleurodeles waltl TaxID=8319 RepID=A0AAV7MGJ5_PLEWA|nr:hypothetical protein NDU88_004407 [Pleurodeles waltl]
MSGVLLFQGWNQVKRPNIRCVRLTCRDKVEEGESVPHWGRSVEAKPSPPGRPSLKAPWEAPLDISSHEFNGWPTKRLPC